MAGDFYDIFARIGVRGLKKADQHFVNQLVVIIINVCVVNGIWCDFRTPLNPPVNGGRPEQRCNLPRLWAGDSDDGDAADAGRGGDGGNGVGIGGHGEGNGNGIRLES